MYRDTDGSSPTHKDMSVSLLPCSIRHLCKPKNCDLLEASFPTCCDLNSAIITDSMRNYCWLCICNRHADRISEFWGLHNRVMEDSSLLGCDAASHGMWLQTFRRYMPSASPEVLNYNPVHTLPPHLFMIHFIFTPTSGPSKWPLFIVFSSQNFLCTYLLHACYIARTLNFFFFHHPNNTWWGLQTM
jgi:hypothetical protein